MDPLDVILSETSPPGDIVDISAAAVIEAARKVEASSTPKAKEMAVSVTTPITAPVTRTPRSSTPRAKTKAAPRSATVPRVATKSATITKPATKPAIVIKPALESATVIKPALESTSKPPSPTFQSESGQGEDVQQQLKKAKEEGERLLKELQKHQAKEVLYLNYRKKIEKERMERILRDRKAKEEADRAHVKPYVEAAEISAARAREKSRGDRDEQRRLMWATHQSLLPPEMRDEAYLEDGEIDEDQLEAETLDWSDSVIQPPLRSQFQDEGNKNK